MSFSITSKVHGNATAASLQIILPSANAGDLIIVFITQNDGPSASVSGGTLGAFQNRISQVASVGAPQYEEEWAIIAPSNITNETITIASLSFGFMTGDAVAISGAKTGGTLAAAFDGSAVGLSTSPADPILISTSALNPHCLIVAAFGTNTASVTAGSGFTLFNSADFQTCEYQEVFSQQTNLSCSLGTSGSNRSIADAIVAAAVSTAVLFAQACL